MRSVHTYIFSIVDISQNLRLGVAKVKKEEIEGIIRDFKSTVGKIRKEKPEIADAFLGLARSVHKEGALSIKEKELICLAISIFARCKTCVVLHTRSSLEAGATTEELMETCGAALMMGGNSLISNVSDVLETIEKISQSSS